MESLTGRVFIITALLLLGWYAGCGEEGFTGPREPVVDISCSQERVCTVFVWYADSVEAYSNGKLYWYDRDISEGPERRLTYREEFPEGCIEVIACNEVGCTNEWREL